MFEMNNATETRGNRMKSKVRKYNTIVINRTSMLVVEH